MWLQRHLQHLASYNSLLWIITTPTPEERSSGYESWGPCLAVFCPMAPYCLLYFLLPTPKNARTEPEGLQFAPATPCAIFMQFLQF